MLVDQEIGNKVSKLFLQLGDSRALHGSSSKRKITTDLVEEYLLKPAYNYSLPRGFSAGLAEYGTAEYSSGSSFYKDT